MKQILVVIFLSLFVASCSSWVYKYDINQGNFLSQRDVNKLRIDMTKEQVQFVLGTALVKNPFRSDNWHYVYTRRVGKTDELERRELVAHFENDRLVKITGDYIIPEEFNQPLDQ